MTAARPAPAVTSCSARSRDLAEPLVGTAPVARAWLVVEQPGPWGARVLDDGSSHLPTGVGPGLQQRADAAGAVTVLLARRPGHHADQAGVQAVRRWWLAYVGLDAPRAVTGTARDPHDLLDLDLSAAARGTLPVGDRVDEPILFVCSNSRRDLCCALTGRPLAGDLAVEAPGRVWECSHLGGHRFSPTALRLPDGLVLGRLDADAGRLALAGAVDDRLTPYVRGWSALTRPQQAAAGIVATAARTMTDRGDEVDVEVADRSGAARIVSVRRVPQTPPRPDSCGKAAATPDAWVALPRTGETTATYSAPKLPQSE